jgi:hypothetical protein
MKFRNKGVGKYSPEDKLTISGVKIEFVPEFTYLGVILQPSGIVFSKHIDKRVRLAMLATFNIKELRNLSIETAIKLFELKVAPIATYALEVIWPFLNKTDFKMLETVKTRYFKRALGVSKKSRSRHIYELLDIDLFASDICQKYSLEQTTAFNKFCEGEFMKKLGICNEFYETETMRKEDWKGPYFDDRHVFARFACHGYHYLFCKNKSFHYDATHRCSCKFCGEKCAQYHILECNEKKLSLREASSMKS